MNRRSMLTTWVPTVMSAALLPCSVVAQEVSLKELVGSWIFVSAQDVKPDGSKVDPWGPNAKGAAMFDANGRFTFMIRGAGAAPILRVPTRSLAADRKV